MREDIPFPDARHDGNERELDGQRKWPLTHELEVALHEIWIALLAELVVVEYVVLQIPGLRQHPVQPVARTLCRSTHGKGAPSEAPAVIVASVFVVAAVARVVRNHCPSAVRPG